MEIGDNFASLFEKIKQLKVSDKTRERLANELNIVRNNVFKYLHVEEPVSSDDKKEKKENKEEKKEEHTSVNHPKYYCSHPENKGELIISNILEISLSFKDNLLSLQIKC